MEGLGEMGSAVMWEEGEGVACDDTMLRGT